MKKCAVCSRTYADSSIAFCLEDGSLLSAPYSPEATVPFAELPTQEIPNTKPSPRIYLKSFDFETVKVNAEGNVIERSKGEAWYLSEKISDTESLDMVEIPSGKFLMGSSDNEEAFVGDKRQHEVTLPKFFMSKFEITWGQWEAVKDLPRISVLMYEGPTPVERWDRPVRDITWYEAMEFCARLSQLTGRKYRLPTEAEWEYACRAGAETRFTYGETITSELEKFNGIAKVGVPNETGEVFYLKTSPVGSLGVANAFGLYDMHGNVREWCMDVCHNDYQGAPSDGSAWLTDGDENLRIVRGGSWLDPDLLCQAFVRRFVPPDDRSDLLGFRVVFREE